MAYLKRDQSPKPTNLQKLSDRKLATMGAIWYQESVELSLWYPEAKHHALNLFLFFFRRWLGSQTFLRNLALTRTSFDQWPYKPDPKLKFLVKTSTNVFLTLMRSFLPNLSANKYYRPLVTRDIIMSIRRCTALMLCDERLLTGSWIWDSKLEAFMDQTVTPDYQAHCSLNKYRLGLKLMMQFGSLISSHHSGFSTTTRSWISILIFILRNITARCFPESTVGFIWNKPSRPCAWLHWWCGDLQI